MRDAKYWADRALNELLMGERSVLEYENALLQAYTIALREIKKEIDPRLKVLQKLLDSSEEM